MNINESIRSNPEDWSLNGEYLFKHKDGLTLWVASGSGYVRLYPNTTGLSWWYRRKIWKAYMWWTDNAPVEALAR